KKQERIGVGDIVNDYAHIDPHTGQKIFLTVKTSLELSLKTLERMRDDRDTGEERRRSADAALNLLDMVAFMGADHIPRFLMQAYAGEDFDGAIGELKNHSILSRDEEEQE